MMCAFDGPPKIYRFHGRGEVLTPLDDGFAGLAELFDVPGLGIRAIVRVHVGRISDSCGYGVPHYEFREQRSSSQNWSKKNGAAAVREYQVKNNLSSIDGMAAMTEAEARAYVAPRKDG